MSTIPRTVLFDTGDLVSTPGAMAAFVRCAQSPFEFLIRHVTGDWGDLSAADKASNTAALRDDTRIFSAYHLADQTKIWVITEADRSATTLLLPEEY